jgi:hypothetical protein
VLVSEIQAAISHPSLLTACQMALAVELNSAASRLVSELPQMRRPRNLGKEEAQAHIGLSSNGYYILLYMLRGFKVFQFQGVGG